MRIAITGAGVVRERAAGIAPPRAPECLPQSRANTRGRSLDVLAPRHPFLPTLGYHRPNVLHPGRRAGLAEVLVARQIGAVHFLVVTGEEHGAHDLAGQGRV